MAIVAFFYGFKQLGSSPDIEVEPCARSNAAHGRKEGAGWTLQENDSCKTW